MSLKDWLAGRKKKKLFKTQVPDLDKFIGREVKIPGQILPIVIEHICGNVGLSVGREKPRPQFYEINGKYLIGMLRFHAQMEGDTSITEQEFEDFENMEFESEKLPTPKTALEQPPKLPRIEHENPRKDPTEH